MLRLKHNVLLYVCVANNCMYIKKTYLVGSAIPGQRCFELISSHQQGIRATCLAHHQFIHTRRTPTLVVQWFQN